MAILILQQVARTSVAAVWGLAVSEDARRLLQELGAVELLISGARRSLEMDCRPDAEADPAAYTRADRPTHGQRQQFQVRSGRAVADANFGSRGWAAVAGSAGVAAQLASGCMPGITLLLILAANTQAAVLGALSVLLVDKACRAPFVKLEPGCATLFELWCVQGV